MMVVKPERFIFWPGGLLYVISSEKESEKESSRKKEKKKKKVG